MKHHPYAALFPMLNDEEIQALADDIAANGLRTPIVIDADGNILDGRNRSVACVIAGVEPVFEPFVGNDEQKLAFVLSANLQRRHLSDNQRAMVAADLKPLYESFAEQRRLANLKKGSKTADGANWPTRGRARDQAAKAVNVSGRSAARAAKVKEKGDEGIIDMVRRDHVAVGTAELVAALSPEEQRVLAAAGPDAVRHAATEIRRKTMPERIAQAKQNSEPVMEKPDYGKSLNEIVALMRRYAEQFPGQVKYLVSAIRQFETKHLAK